MKDKYILFIDDEDITQIINKIRTILKKQGITLIETVFPINAQFRKLHPDNPHETVLDFELIKERLKTEIMINKYDYVVCDFNFKDSNLNGFKLIRWLKNFSKSNSFKIRSAKFSLYSSEKDKSIKETFSEDELVNLIKLKLEDFYDRAKISEEFGTSIINNSQDLNLKEKLIEELVRYSEMEFKSGYPKFENLKIGKIINEIENETFHGRGFQEALIEITVAHMIDLNKI